MVTARDINDIQALKPDEQVLVLSLVKSFVKSPENSNEVQKRLWCMSHLYVVKNPMTMDEINSVIEGE